MKYTPKYLISYFRSIRRENQELLWARIWDDTKHNLDWIEKMPGISPGRMAVGYNYLYVMTRILNDLKPKHVLDMGLGISSTLISYYMDYYNKNDSYHTVIEHNRDWIDFYTKNNRVSGKTEIIVRRCIQENYKGCIYNSYEGLKDSIIGKKYSVISIDGPLGSNDEYSRRDILKIIPDVLEDSFVIILDDVNRKGELNTVREIEEILQDNNIPYFEGFYYGITDCCVVTSKDNQFICSL